MRNHDEKKHLKRLIRNWEKYRELVIGALAESETTSRQEKRFLQLKAALAEQIQVLAGSIPRPVAYESKQQLEAMAELVKRHVTLDTKDMGTRWERKDFENTWHQYYIFLNRLRGMELADDTRSHDLADAPRGRSSRLWSSLGWTAAIAVLGLALYLAASAAGLSVGSSSGFSLAVPQTFGDALHNASEAFGSLAAGVSYLVEPVIAAYGMVWLLVIVGAVVVLLSFFMTMRT